jgi:intein/homing endonuclease
MKNKKIPKTKLIQEVISLEHKLNRKPMKRDNSSLNYYARKLFGSWNNLMKASGYEVKFYQKINSIKFNEDFAYFLGLLVTDGHIYFNKNLKNYKVAIYTSYPEEKEMLLKLIQYLFNYNAPVTSRMYGFNKKPNYEIRIESKNLARIIMNDYDIPSGAKSLTVLMPTKIMNGSNKIKMAFLRGVIDGDGSIFNNNVKIASGSIEFLNGLKKLLDDLTIFSGRIIKDNKITNTFSIRICRRKDLIKIKSIYNAKYCYKRKKENIDKI